MTTSVKYRWEVRMGSSLALRHEQNLKGKKKDSSSFLARAQPLKSHGLHAFYNLPNFVFPCIKCFCFVSSCPSDTCIWLTMVADFKLQFSADPEKPIFCWGNRLIISDQ